MTNKNAKIFKLPLLGRFVVAKDRHGSALGGMAGAATFQTNLSVKVFDKDGNEKKVRNYFGNNFGQKLWHALLYRNQTELDLGSGLVTNVGVTALANEAITLASPSGARINTLFLANFHASGTGATAAAATDFKIQTISTNGGQTPVAGTQSIDTSSTIAVPKYKTVATIAYTGSEAVTEWGLFTNGTLSSTTGTPFTAATATTFTATATPFTASSSTVQGLQQQIVVPGTTTVLGLISSNTTSVGTLFNNGTTGWFTQAAQTAGSTPGNTEAYTLRPIMWDHKVFSAINVVNGDSIQFTYTLTINSGG
jgi:hypothetical protein